MARAQLTQNVGTTSAPQTVTVTISAAGTLSPTLATAIQVTTQGVSNLDYNYVSGGTCTPGTAYNVGNTCTVMYIFSPTHPYLRPGGVALVDGSSNLLGAAYLTGQGVGPQPFFLGTVANPNTVATLNTTGLGHFSVNEAGDIASLTSYTTAASGYTTFIRIPINGVIAAGWDGLGNLLVNAGVGGGGQVFATSKVSGYDFTKTQGILTPFASGSNPTGGKFDSLGDFFGYLQDNSTPSSPRMFDDKWLVTNNYAAPTGLHSWLGAPLGIGPSPDGSGFAALFNESFVPAPHLPGVEVSSSNSATYGYLGDIGLTTANNAADVAMDNAGEMFLADTADKKVWYIPVADMPASLISVGSGFGGPMGLQVDPSGDLFVGDGGTGGGFKKIIFSQPYNVTFPTRTNAGSTDTTDGEIVLTLQNNGNDLLTATGTGFGGLTSGNFTNTGNGSCTSGYSFDIATSQTGIASCTVTLQFTPQNGTSGTLTDTFSFINNAGTQTFPLTGTSLSGPTFGSMSFSPAASVPFGTSQAITITDTLTYNSVQPTGAMTFTLNGVGYTATCTTAGSPETCSATVPAGTIAALNGTTYSVTPTIAGDGQNYAPATGASGAFTVTPIAKTITFPQPPSPVNQFSSATMTATASGGDPVTYAITGGTATVAGNMVTYSDTGTVTITASSAATQNYMVATPVSVNVTVALAAYFVNWEPSTLSIYTGAALDATILDATSTIAATIGYTATLQPSGTPTSVNTSTTPAAGSYLLQALITPGNTAYANVGLQLLFTVQNMNVFVGQSNGHVSSFYNNGRTQSASTTGGGIGAAVDSHGFVWSIATDGNSLQTFTDTGATAASYGSAGVNGATALAIDGLGNVLVANGDGSVSVVGNNGAAKSTMGSSGAAVSSVAIDTSGNVWLAHPTTNRMDEVLGGAAPVNPISTAVTLGKPATLP